MDDLGMAEYAHNWKTLLCDRLYFNAVWRYYAIISVKSYNHTLVMTARAGRNLSFLWLINQRGYFVRHKFPLRPHSVAVMNKLLRGIMHPKTRIIFLIITSLLLPNFSVADDTPLGMKETISKLELEIKNIKDQLAILESNVSQTENAVNKLNSARFKSDKSANIWLGSFNLPVGSIIPWIPNNHVPEIELDKETNLPKGFLACNGPHRIDNLKTKFDERKIPNLSAGSLFNGKEREEIIMIIKVDAKN